MPSVWDFLILPGRLGLYFGVAGTLGACFALLTFQHAGHSQSLRRYLQLSAGLGLLAIAVNFPARAAAMSGDLAGAFDPLFLSILWRSGIGSSAQWQLFAFVVLLLASLTLGRAGALRRLTVPLMLSGAIALLWSFTFSGHFAGESGFNKSALALHVLGMSLWLGSFYPLLTLLKSPQAQHNLETFSSIGVWIVALLLTCGLWMAVILLPTLSDLFGTAYGRVLLGKVALLLVLLALAAANKWIWVRRLDTEPEGIRRSIHGEVLVGLLILLVTAALANLVSPH